MPGLRSPNDLLANELKQIHSAERQLSKALPKLARTVSSDTLRDLIDRRREQGSRLIDEVESALDEIGLRAGRSKNLAVEGLIDECKQQIDEVEDDNMRDAALVGEIQKIEHYCIAAWGTSKALGGLLDHEAVVEAMARALDEGKEFDAEMTELAESEINPRMLSGASEEEEEGGRSSRGGRARSSSSRARGASSGSGGRGKSSGTGSQSAKSRSAQSRSGSSRSGSSRSAQSKSASGSKSRSASGSKSRGSSGRGSGTSGSTGDGRSRRASGR